MKKIIAGLFAATTAASGLVAFSAAPSDAAPYPGTIDTNCSAEALNNPRVGNPAKVEFRVTTGGNGSARGLATFSYERKSSGIVVDEFTRHYRGPAPEKYAFDGLPRGHYVVRVFFNSKPGDSVYKNCRTNFDQDVRRAG